MGTRLCRAAKLAAPVGLATICAFATPAFAETSEISAADTAWMIVATALVLMTGRLWVRWFGFTADRRWLPIRAR